MYIIDNSWTFHLLLILQKCLNPFSLQNEHIWLYPQGTKQLSHLLITNVQDNIFKVWLQLFLFNEHNAN